MMRDTTNSSKFLVHRELPTALQCAKGKRSGDAFFAIYDTVKKFFEIFEKKRKKVLTNGK